MIGPYKIVFTGPTGVGKTTAIASISEIDPVTTEMAAVEDIGKATTTAALDYGELTLDQGDKLKLYGTPGQPRFRFMWQILGHNALAVVFMINGEADDVAADLQCYLEGFAEAAANGVGIVAVNRVLPGQDLEPVYQVLEAAGLCLPVVMMDPRERKDVLKMMDALLTLMEFS